MNYFFFLDHPDSTLNSAIEIFNRAPMDLFYKQEKDKKKIYIFYAEDNIWKNQFFCNISYNDSLIIKKTDLPKKFHNMAVLVSITSKNLKENEPPFNDKSMDSIPAWRSNIKIFNNFTSTSYQGEFPGSFLNLNLSLTSCSPFIQFNTNIENYFYLINFNKDPLQKKFKVELLNSKKELLDSFNFMTNNVNVLKLNPPRNDKTNDNMYIFRSRDYGGIPLYFSRSNDSKSFSLEHTHPPQEYLFLGDRGRYQKKKKSFWNYD